VNLMRPGQAFCVPTDRVILRVSGALHAKATAIRTYRDKGIIDPNHQALVAINVRGVPFGLDTWDGCAFGATYGVGSQFVTIDRDTLAVVDSGYKHRPMLVRASGNSVDAAPFLHPGFEHVSGTLFSAANAANTPSQLGVEFRLLPNPNAAPAYSEGQLPIGREGVLHREGDAYRIDMLEHAKASRGAAG
jgi:hypothetical protein